MDLDLDTFLVALYSTIDDLYQEEFAQAKPTRRGHKPELSDSEVLTLMIYAQWSGHSERRTVSYAQAHWRSYFPRLLSQSATNRRARDLSGVLVRMVSLVASRLESALSAYQVMDALPVEIMRKCRGMRGRLFADEADVGVGGADKRFYYGCQLLLSVDQDGLITGFLLAPASTNVRWLADRMLCWRIDPYLRAWSAQDLPYLNKRKNGGMVGVQGPIWPRDGVGAYSPEPYIADGGFSGRVWLPHWRSDYQALVLVPEGYEAEDAEAAKAEHRRWRHVVETVNAHLEQDLHLAFCRARTRWGLLTRVAAKLAAFNLGILLNRAFGRPDFAVATLFSW